MKNLAKAGWYRIVNVDESSYKLMEGTGVSTKKRPAKKPATLLS